MAKIRKAFDCLEFEQRAQARIYEDIKDMTPEEEAEYFRERADRGPLGPWWQRVKSQQSK